MIIYKEESLKNFQFWSDAKYLASCLTEKEFDIIEELLEELYPDGMEDTQINDFFWFEGNLIAQALGYKDEDDLMKSAEEYYYDHQRNLYPRQRNLAY